MIRRGAADAVLAGGTESCIVPLILAGFTAMRGLAVEDEHPAARLASVRRDARRLRDGGGRRRLLLERSRAPRRAAPKIYAEVLGYGASNDAHHMAQPEPEATGVAAMMTVALERAGVEPERVGYINAHGTSTPLGDAAETRAIKQVFGDHAYELAVSSTKSMMGHTFGAAGAIEAILSALALHDGVLPPTINYREPDPDCDLDYVPNEATPRAGRRRALERDGARRPQRLRAPRPRMKLTLVRNATLLLETSGKRDPRSIRCSTTRARGRRSRTPRTTCGTRSSAADPGRGRRRGHRRRRSSRTCTRITSTIGLLSSSRRTIPLLTQPGSVDDLRGTRLLGRDRRAGRLARARRRAHRRASRHRRDRRGARPCLGIRGRRRLRRRRHDLVRRGRARRSSATGRTPSSSTGAARGSSRAIRS